MMVSVVFADIENMPEYGFDFKALTVTLILFVLTYELVMYLYSRSIKSLPSRALCWSRKIYGVFELQKVEQRNEQVGKNPKSKSVLVVATVG